jgi:hypothetical protein
LSSGWQNSHNFEVWKNFPTPFLCKWHYNALSSAWASKVNLYRFLFYMTVRDVYIF